ncbi:MAG: 2Fe-2S iron-sulfur cluster binding domain-containing protein [gamma proteobacterium symbiont of Bathyaustriella thionipta]|nr:2Fe-2S iron-sulfur cluster binding domain-containing protein [gamma proteobacterium symbiont of Bathyaustriella thionipta]MCU7951022.1 2Fe-2S iron-sulfur cluster binding domain-containing protein [gamma proteobacterium symbiont of Bathyaustriella thionipta]MCU7954380.1 2Fe-2S iron-sulfur cluster binding domain-containing protein [gamma proteobacterium symbiont of Bathyaustriella thionipta]MCU7957528.1 2Fe-2S iron-sulfur cluster binding domain-containing protein [gamma proteobacterium symbiont
MDRHLSLSQAARLIGVKRGDIQKKIQENKLTVMEGTVVLSDLKKAFPEASYEDNTMLEKMEKFMQDAVHKMAQSERDGAQVDALSRRLVKINKELAIERNRAYHMEELIDGMKQKFIDLSANPNQENAYNELKQWFHTATSIWEEEKFTTPVEQLENQIEQFMLPHIRLLPSRHDYVSSKSETLLESALRSGLAVDYGCNNGKCGKCKAKLLTGQVEKTGHQDFVFSESEKSQGYILTCSNTAKTDITLETEEAVSVDDIPLQTITTKVKEIERLNEHVIILTLKTPRSQRLRFLAGQHIELFLDNHLQDNNQPINAEYSIASCPCNANILEFHIPVKEDERFAKVIMQDLKQNESITLNGPHGNFVLDEDSPNSLIFIAWDTGFSPIKSLIEHAMSLDHADTIHLYWMTTKVENHYMHNLCRSWNDALDNFTYTRIMCEAKTDVVADSLLQHLHNEHNHLLNFDLYIAAPGHLNHLLKPLLTSHGVKGQNMHFESTFHGDDIID